MIIIDFGKIWLVLGKMKITKNTLYTHLLKCHTVLYKYIHHHVNLKSITWGLKRWLSIKRTCCFRRRLSLIPSTSIVCDFCCGGTSNPLGDTLHSGPQTHTYMYN